MKKLLLILLYFTLLTSDSLEEYDALIVYEINH